MKILENEKYFTQQSKLYLMAGLGASQAVKAVLVGNKLVVLIGRSFYIHEQKLTIRGLNRS